MSIYNSVSSLKTNSPQMGEFYCYINYTSIKLVKKPLTNGMSYQSFAQHKKNKIISVAILKTTGSTFCSIINVFWFLCHCLLITLIAWLHPFLLILPTTLCSPAWPVYGHQSRSNIPLKSDRLLQACTFSLVCWESFKVYS